MAAASATKWTAKLHDFVPNFLAENTRLAPIAPAAAILLHGSTTLGFDDAQSDLDLWLLLTENSLKDYQCGGDSRFIEFKLEGKPGHLTVESIENFDARIRRCDLPLIFELRLSEVIADATGAARRVIDVASGPMRPEVRQVWFQHHYVEMRSDHRAADNPIERGFAVPILLAVSQTIAHAFRAACVLDSVPYPYIKWLEHAASQTPVGSLVCRQVQEIIDLLDQNALRFSGPEKESALSNKLRDIRNTLNAAAAAHGITGPWLKQWWLHIPASREGILNVEW